MVEALGKEALGKDSNGDGSIFVGRGMSRAFQRAKERENLTPDELVMAETKISRS